MPSRKISIRVSTDLYDRMKATADQEGVTMSEIVRALLSGWVDDPHPVFASREDGSLQVGGVEWWARTMEMTLEELMGAILARAQVLEEFMRHYIAMERDCMPRQVKGPFGKLRKEFADLHPGETALLSSLEVANDVRNEAAHSNVLVANFIRQVLSDFEPDGVDRFLRKGVRESLYAIQEALIHMLEFFRRNPLEYDDGIPRAARTQGER